MALFFRLIGARIFYGWWILALGSILTAVGMGILAGPWRLNLAAVNQATLVPGDSKGLALAVGTSLVF